MPRLASLGFGCEQIITYILLINPSVSTKQGTSLRRGRLAPRGGRAEASVAAPKRQGRGRHFAPLRRRHICFRSLVCAGRLSAKSPLPPLRAEIGHIASCARLLASLPTAKEPAPSLRSQPALCPATLACSLSPLPCLGWVQASLCSVASPAWCCVFTFVNSLQLYAKCLQL